MAPLYVITHASGGLDLHHPAGRHHTLKGQLDLELHGGRSLTGVTTRVAQRLLALTAAIWHNRATGQPLTRTLIAYDH